MRQVSIRRIALLLFPAAMVMMLFFPLLSHSNIILPQENVTVTMGVEQSLFSEVDLKDAQLALELWISNLADQTGFKYKTRSITFNDLDSMLKAILSEELQIININAVDFVSIHSDLPIEPFLVPGKRGSPMTHYLLVVHRSSGITRISQLKNKTLAMKSGGHRKISRLWLDHLIKSKGLDESNLFLAIKVMDKPSQVVLPVFFKQMDACIIPEFTYETMGELNPQIKENLMVLEESPGLLHQVCCLHKSIDPEIRKKILDSAYRLHETSSGQQILTLFQMDQALPFNFSYLSNLRTLVDFFNLK